MISIAQNGQMLGQFSADEVAAMLESGQIDKTAHYWMEGMAEWEAITEIIQANAQEDLATSAPATTRRDDRVPQKKRSADAPNQSHVNFLVRRGFPTTGMTKQEVANLYDRVRSEEARKANEITERQKAFLDYHGVRYSAKTTKAEASALISGADFPDSQWNDFKHLLHPDLYDKPSISATRAEEVTAAQQALKEAQKKLTILQSDPNATQDDLDEAEGDIETAKENLQDARDFSESGSGDETLLESWPDDLWPFYGEEAIAPAAEILRKPTKSQLQSIRKKLGEDLGLRVESLSLWQFCCVYAQTFPNAVKKGKRNPFGELPIPPRYDSHGSKQGATHQQSKGSGGCLRLLLWLVIPSVLFALLAPILTKMSQ